MFKIKKHLETFLEDGQLDISNNLCGSHIRLSATARRAGLLVATPTINAILYTFEKISNFNKLNVYTKNLITTPKRASTQLIY